MRLESSSKKRANCGRGDNWVLWAFWSSPPNLEIILKLVLWSCIFPAFGESLNKRSEHWTFSYFKITIKHTYIYFVHLILLWLLCRRKRKSRKEAKKWVVYFFPPHFHPCSICCCSAHWAATSVKILQDDPIITCVWLQERPCLLVTCFTHTGVNCSSPKHTLAVISTWNRSIRFCLFFFCLF